MAIKGYFGPPSERRSRKVPVGPKLPPILSQSELRDRRRKGFSVVYGSQFSLTVEVADLVTPVAAGIAADVGPRAFREDVERLCDRVHELIGTVVGWTTEHDAYAKTAHVAGDDRARSVRLLVDLADRPAALTITDAMLASGNWSTELVEMARPHDAALSGLLSRAPRPGYVIGGALSLSERLEAALRAVDLAVLELAQQMKWIAYCRADNAAIAATVAGNDPKTRARNELREMGIDA